MSVTAMRQARQAAVKIDPAEFVKFAIQDAITGGARCTKGIPADAEFIRYHWTGESVALIYEHESFGMVCLGAVIPFIELEFEDIDPFERFRESLKVRKKDESEPWIELKRRPDQDKYGTLTD